MSEMIVFANEPMNREESANFNDDNAGVDLAESVNCVPDITNSNSNLKVDQVDEDEEIIDILGIDSPEPMPSSDFNNFEAYFEENDKTAAQSKASPVEENKASAETSRSTSPIFDFSAWAPPPRQAAKAAMSKINSHDYQASTSVKVTPKAVKTINVEKPCKIAKASTPSAVKVKPSVSAVPPPSAPEASTHNDDEEATELPESDVDKKKRKVPHRQTRTAKSVGFYNERFDCLQRRHKATKGATLDMEDAISEGVELVEQVLDGSSTIYKLFDTYKNACTAFKRASATLRQTILLERKLASEVWGDNVVATFRDGVFTIDKTAIDACLNRPAAPPTFKTERHHTKRLSKPVERYAPSPDTSVSDKRKRVSKAADTAVSVLPPGRSRRKVVPVAESQPPVKKLKLRSSNVSSSPHPQRVPTPVPPPKLSQAPKPSQQPPLPPPLPPPSKPGKRPPLPKFKFIEDNIITRDALRHVKENAVISCMCSTDDNGIRCLDNCVNRLLHVECGSRCIGCQNKRFTNKQYAGFEPFFTGTKGWGIRATEPIRPGQFIVEYLGEVVDEQERDRRLVQYTRNNHKHHYMMAITGAVIDATSFGNYSRFVNHSCDPNAETQKWVAQKMSRVGFFALKHIAVGEEIVFDYDFETLGEAAQPCFCGAKNCLGFIGTKKKALAATGGDMDDDDGVSDDDENSDAEDDEMEPATMPTPKPKKRKLTEQERDFRKRVAKMRKKLLKMKRIMRTVIGRKKVFLEDDIRVFNRNMFAIQDQEVRFLLLNYLMTITDDTWMTWFVEAQGIGIMYTWIVDNLASGKSLRSVLRFNVRLLEFLQRLPIINPIVFNKVNFLDLLKKILVIELPEETIIAETLNDLTEKIIRDIGDEPPIVDEDLARLVKRDGISVLDLHAELLQRSKDLLDKWSQIEPPPEQPSPEVEPIVNTKDYGADEFGSLYPLRAHTPDSPIPVSPANEFSEPECDTRASFSKSYGGVEAEERRSRRRSWSRSNDRSHHSHHSRGFSTYRRHRSRSRSCERSRYNDHRRRYDNDRSSGRIRYSRYRSRSRSPIRIRDDRRDRSHYRGHYHQRDRRRTSDERRYRRDRSRSPRRHSRSRYTSPRPSSSARDNAKLKEIKSEPVEHSTHLVSSKHSDDSPQIVPEPITPVLPQSQTSKLDIFNVFEQPSSSIASKGPLLIHINGVTSANASAAVTPMSNVSGGNLPGTGPKWLSTVQNVGYVKPTTTAPVMVPPPVNSYTYSSEEVYNASVSNYYSDHSLSFYQASIFQPPPPPEPEEESPVKVEVMDPSPSSVVSDPMHRSLDEEAGEEDSFVEDEKNKIYQPNPDWIETFTDDGIVYYYHRETRESMWTEPPPKVAEKPLAVVEMSESHSASVSAATTSSSETSESQSLRNGVKVDANAELTETSHSSSDPHHHVRHKSSRRYHELPDNITELKTVFKREVWQHVFPYLKSRPGVAVFEDNVLVQYARKMTHYTLDNELNTGNVQLKLSKEVFSKARRYVDRGLPGFLKSHGNIEAL